MTKAKVARRTVAVVAASLLLAVALSSDSVVQARGRSHDLPGTWFISLPQGLTGFYTYNQDGTMTGVVSTIFGAPPQPSEPFFNTESADHGIWRRVRHGFEGVVFRISFEQSAGVPVTIIRIRTFFAFDPGRDSTSGTFLVDEWNCPTALTCPDPNSNPPGCRGHLPAASVQYVHPDPRSDAIAYRQRRPGAGAIIARDAQ